MTAMIDKSKFNKLPEVHDAMKEMFPRLTNFRYRDLTRDDVYHATTESLVPREEFAAHENSKGGWVRAIKLNDDSLAAYRLCDLIYKGDVSQFWKTYNMIFNRAGVYARVDNLPESLK